MNFFIFGGNEQSTHKYVSELLGKETIDMNTYGKSSGRSGNYSTNYQIGARELMTPDEVRLLDNKYALLFIRGERPVMDFKYDILKHPNVVFTTDGKGKPYIHGGTDKAKATIKQYKIENSKYSNRHTFSGKLVCGCCGASYVAGESRKRKDGTIRKSWRCNTIAKYGKKHIDNLEVGCDNKRVNNELLKICFMKSLQEILNNKNEIKKDVEEYVKIAIKKCEKETQCSDILLKEKEMLYKEKNKLLDLCIKEIIDEEIYNSKNKEIQSRMIKLEKQLKEQEDRIKIRDNTKEILNNASDLVDNILNFKKFSKNVCKELIEKVIIYSDKKFDFYLKGNKTPFFLRIIKVTFYLYSTRDYDFVLL